MVVEATSGGIGRHVRDLSLGLCDSGEQVSVVYSPIRQDEGFAEFLRALSARGQRAYRVPMRRAVGRPWQDARAMLAIRRLLRQVGPDLVHGHSSKGGALARLAVGTLGIPSVYTANAFPFAARDAPIVSRLVFGAIERWLAQRTALLIAVSDAEAELVREYALPARQVRTVYNGIDAAPFVCERAPRTPDAPLRVITLGRLTWQKDPHLWARIARGAAGRGIQLTWVGPGPPRVRRRLARRSPGEVAGPVAPTGVPALLAGADAYLLTSRYEGLPYAVLEAMASGLPAVCRACPGASELVVPGVTGLLVHSDRPEAFIDALDELRADPARAHAMGEEARARVLSHYDVRRMVEDTRTAYQECLEGSPS